MTGKQNLVFWLGISLMVVAFWFGGQLTSLWQSIAPPSSSSSKSKSPPAPHGKGPGGRPIGPKG